MSQNMLRAVRSEELATRLVRFACAFAWVDGGPRPQEWTIINALAERLGVSPEVRLKIRDWLTTRPPLDDVRFALPPEHLRLFLAVARLVADSDGRRNEVEERALSWFTRSILEIERSQPLEAAEAA